MHASMAYLGFVYNGKQANNLSHCWEFPLGVYVIAPVGRDWFRVSRAQNFMEHPWGSGSSLGSWVEIRILPEYLWSTERCRTMVLTSWGWHRMREGRERECHGDIWQDNPCSSLHPEFRSCSFRLCCLEEVFQKVWQAKSAGVHHYYIASALSLQIDSQGLLPLMNSDIL